MFGYHGVSSRLYIHMCPGEYARPIQIRFPNAAAKCTTDVSIDTSKSKLSRIAVVSEKSLMYGPRSVKSIPAGGVLDCTSDGPFCRPKYATPGTSPSGAYAASDADRKKFSG